ncbi:MAG: hypothetical protein DWQ37_22125 [Planctomycetota bacterium]|nr:MAG: hypothetical protein DWQ37_22125 [Planctomycetota bacterium]
MGQRWLDGYSADVEIYLLIDGKRFDVAQITDGSLILRDSYEIPAETAAELVLKIDGHEEREKIFLRSGSESREEPVPFF